MASGAERRSWLSQVCYFVLFFAWVFFGRGNRCLTAEANCLKGVLGICSLGLEFLSTKTISILFVKNILKIKVHDGHFLLKRSSCFVMIDWDEIFFRLFVIELFFRWAIWLNHKLLNQEFSLALQFLYLSLLEAFLKLQFLNLWVQVPNDSISLL